MRTTEIGACTPPCGITPGIRRPVRTITRPPISSRRIRFGEPTSSTPSGVIVAAFSPSPCSRIAAAASKTTLFSVVRRVASERSKRSSSTSSPITEGSRTRSASSSSSCPVSSPSRTASVGMRRILRRWVHGSHGTARRLATQGPQWRFRYVDASGQQITDSDHVERIEALAIPPAWREVWISPAPRAKLQATGLDRAGRTQYLYHPEFRARQEQEKFDRLVRFAERLPELRGAMSEELAEAMKTLLELPGGRQLFRYELDGERCNLTGARLNEYIGEHMGEEFTAKDFRTWAGRSWQRSRSPSMVLARRKPMRNAWLRASCG